MNAHLHARFIRLACWLCLLLPLGSMAQEVSVSRLTTEHLANPMGIDTSTPRLSWQLESDQKNVRQEAYHILVASTPELLAQDKGDLWDSGKTASAESQNIVYAGKALKSDTRCYWKVKSYTSAGETVWSETSRWSVGLLGEVHWKGRWIGWDQPSAWDREDAHSRLSARYLRKEFEVKKPVKQATVYICGLGMYEMFINGKRIGDQVLAPLPSDYRKTLFYDTYDVTSLLTDKNAIGVTLGNGRYYTMQQHYRTYKIVNFGYPKLRMNLLITYQDGTTETIKSDTDWRITTDGPIRSNNEYDGETYDARKELGDWTLPGYDDSQWEPVQRVGAPGGTPRGMITPPMKVIKTIQPVHIRAKGDRYIVDMGQNIAGWLRARICGNEGDTIRLRFSETLTPEGELYTANLREAQSTDYYICNGKENGKTWAPRFVYHGFRYVEISGYKDAKLSDFTGEVVSDEVEPTGTFECSDETLNRVYKNAWWGILGNYKGMPVDCPQRDERQPWLGDRTMGCWGESYLFDINTLYSKWTRDICESQREDGCFSNVAPAFWMYYDDNVTWPAVLPFACDMLYTQFGNREPMERCYPAIRKWMLHLRREYMQDGLITKDKYGDWCVPPESLELIHSKDPARITDGTLISTAYYIKLLDVMQRFASLQNLKEDQAQWAAWAKEMKEAFNRKYLHIRRGTSQKPGHPLYPDSVYYGNNTVTSNVLPLAFNIVPNDCKEDVAKQIVSTTILKNGGHISCGVIGVQWLLQELSRNGFADVAFLLASKKTYPSWGYMAEQGATTTWELWNGNTADPKMNSGNHVMLLGGLLPWCYEHAAGIRSDSTQTGFRHIILKPDFDIQNLFWAKASYRCPYGTIKSAWKKTLTHLEWDITIPCNTTAEVHLPDGRVEQIGSGDYHYSADIPALHPAVLENQFLYEKASFPECHASTIVELENGDLVAAFFGGTKERNPDVCIWVCRKPKGSDTWTEPVKVADGVFDLNDPDAKIAGITADIKDHRKACWNPVLFQVPGGDLLLFFKIGLNVPDWTGWLVRSKDGGKTWSQREALPLGFLGPIKNKPEFINGRILCPSSTEGEQGWRIHIEYSDDMGKTWKTTGPIPAELEFPSQYRNMNADEKEKRPILVIQPSILKHKDGTLQVICRTRNSHLATSWSKDNGSTWSKVTLIEGLPNNNSGTDAVTLQDGRHALVYNNFSPLLGDKKGVRTPINLALSDDGIHWTPVLTLEDSPVREYSYPAIIQGKDGKLHITFTWRRELIKYMEIDLNKLEKK